MNVVARLKRWWASLRREGATVEALSRVEAILLIHGETGSLLEHVSQPGASLVDVDLVSGMLTAIMRFVNDRFGQREGELTSFVLGDRAVCIATGPYAVLAVSVKGAIPANLHERLQNTLFRIHDEYGKELAEYSGDNDAFRRTAGLLEPLLYGNHPANPAPA